MRAILAMAALAALSAAAVGCGGLPDCKNTMSSLGGPDKVCGLVFDREKGECIQKAEICPNLSPVNFCYKNAATPSSVSLDNFGEDSLTISSIEIQGDTHCAFKVTPSVPLGTAIKGEGFSILQIDYTPSDPGTEDQVTLVIKSNAENFPELKLELCGKSAMAGDETKSCLPPDGFLCKGASTTQVNMSCGT